NKNMKYGTFSQGLPTNMIGLIVQVTADLVKIWSTSSHRLMSYGIDDVPKQSREGDWIEIDLYSNGVMRGMRRMQAHLETRRDERGGMQV
ncbi:hypothetical protein PFISCL1PPCAC_16251, partial [Pristionchus fissidentatus]